MKHGRSWFVNCTCRALCAGDGVDERPRRDVLAGLSQGIELQGHGAPSHADEYVLQTKCIRQIDYIFVQHRRGLNVEMTGSLTKVDCSTVDKLRLPS